LTVLTQHLADLDAADQLGLVSDTASLAFAGAVPLAQFADVVRHVPRDADPVVWIAVVDRLDALDRAYGDGGRQAAFRAAARALVHPLFAAVGWEPSAGEGATVPLLRDELIDALTRWGDPALIATGRSRFEAFLRDPDVVTAAVRSHVLRVAARQADVATWEQLEALAAASTSPLEQTPYYGLLGLAADPVLGQRALDLALSASVPQTLRAGLIQSVATEQPDLATQYAIAHWAVIEPLIEPGSLSSYVPRLAMGSADLARIDALTGFATARIPASARNTVRVAIAEIRYRAALRARLGGLDDWLGSHSRP
jgi:aminopeptidase N